MEPLNKGQRGGQWSIYFRRVCSNKGVGSAYHSSGWWRKRVTLWSMVAALRVTSRATSTHSHAVGRGGREGGRGGEGRREGGRGGREG